MKGIKTTSITNWLIKINMLEYFADENGKNHKIPTENGIQLGITTQERVCTVHIKSFYMTAMSNNLYLTI